jgi:hypothetical protein
VISLFSLFPSFLFIYFYFLGFNFTLSIYLIYVFLLYLEKKFPSPKSILNDYIECFFCTSKKIRVFLSYIFKKFSSSGGYIKWLYTSSIEFSFHYLSLMKILLLLLPPTDLSFWYRDIYRWNFYKDHFTFHCFPLQYYTNKILFITIKILFLIWSLILTDTCTLIML